MVVFVGGEHEKEPRNILQAESQKIRNTQAVLFFIVRFPSAPEDENASILQAGFLTNGSFSPQAFPESTFQWISQGSSPITVAGP